MKTQNPVAVVTGGGTGIGRAVAIALARNDFQVIVTGRRHAALEGVAASSRRVSRQSWRT